MNHLDVESRKIWYYGNLAELEYSYSHPESLNNITKNEKTTSTTVDNNNIIVKLQPHAGKLHA
jgi:hypothetical protein